jgi:hypothetical protein
MKNSLTSKSLSAGPTEQAKLANSAKVILPISPRIVLLPLGVIRVTRGNDAESILNCVGDATHPKFLRWVFNVAVNLTRTRNLRFWKDEVLGDPSVDKWGEPKVVISRILGTRQTFPRAEIEVQWTISAQTILLLVRAGELEEVNHKLTHASLAAFLERRLQ